MQVATHMEGENAATRSAEGEAEGDVEEEGECDNRIYRWSVQARARSLLERSFETDPYPRMDARTRIANQLKVTQRQVQIWFQNRRQREQRQCDQRTVDERKRARASSSQLQIPPECMPPRPAASTPSLPGCASPCGVPVGALAAPIGATFAVPGGIMTHNLQPGGYVGHNLTAQPGGYICQGYSTFVRPGDAQVHANMCAGGQSHILNNMISGGVRYMALPAQQQSQPTAWMPQYTRVQQAAYPQSYFYNSRVQCTQQLAMGSMGAGAAMPPCQYLQHPACIHVPSSCAGAQSSCAGASPMAVCQGQGAPPPLPPPQSDQAQQTTPAPSQPASPQTSK